MDTLTQVFSSTLTLILLHRTVSREVDTGLDLGIPHLITSLTYSTVSLVYSAEIQVFGNQDERKKDRFFGRQEGMEIERHSSHS